MEVRQHLAEGFKYQASRTKSAIPSAGIITLLMSKARTILKRPLAPHCSSQQDLRSPTSAVRNSLTRQFLSEVPVHFHILVRLLCARHLPNQTIPTATNMLVSSHIIHMPPNRTRLQFSAGNLL